ncbi:MAG: CGNR zinc finger domain-containing protein [Anaerolineales bacterium]|jgi:predicted RNA-binding Zn ribbon-like protein
MDEKREAENHRLVGGELCLDFANTLNGHARLPHHEYLQDYRDTVLWGRHAGALPADEAATLLSEAARRPAEAEIVYRKGLELRETIFRIFSSLADGNQVDRIELELLNAAWRDGQSHTRLAVSSGGFSLGWDDEPCLERLLRAVTDSAIHLLVSPQCIQVRSCAGANCDWLFVDSSRNHLRRWCSMDECGNRAKMQRRQARQRLPAPGR